MQIHPTMQLSRMIAKTGKKIELCDSKNFKNTFFFPPSVYDGELNGRSGMGASPPGQHHAQPSSSGQIRGGERCFPPGWIICIQTANGPDSGELIQGALNTNQNLIYTPWRIYTMVRLAPERCSGLLVSSGRLGCNMLTAAICEAWRCKSGVESTEASIADIRSRRASYCQQPFRTDRISQGHSFPAHLGLQPAL